MRVYQSLLVAAVLAASVTAGAQGPGFGPGFGMHRPPMEKALGPEGPRGQWWNNPSLVERLKLTDDQRKAMDQILLQHRETLIDMRANLQKAELAMEPLMQEDQPNEAKILAQIDKVAQARAELEKANARFLLALRSKLSAEQWKGLQAARSEHMQHRDRDWRDNGPRPNRPGPGAQPPAGGPGPGPQGMLHAVPGEDGPAGPQIGADD